MLLSCLWGTAVQFCIRLDILRLNRIAKSFCFLNCALRFGFLAFGHTLALIVPSMSSEVLCASRDCHLWGHACLEVDIFVFVDG